MVKYSLFIGRYQPLHAGHIELIKKVLREGERVLVALRDTPVSNKNPYSTKERKKMFGKAFKQEIKNKTLRIITIPDISAVCFGRKVGYKIREIRLNNKIEKISATNIRKYNASK